MKNKIQKKYIKELILLISSFILGSIFTIILLVFSPLSLILNSNNGITITKDKTKIYGHKHWICKCQCGTIRSVDGNTLRNGKSTSCGC